jgi:hypothetical protein
MDTAEDWRSEQRLRVERQPGGGGELGGVWLRAEAVSAQVVAVTDPWEVVMVRPALVEGRTMQ